MQEKAYSFYPADVGAVTSLQGRDEVSEALENIKRYLEGDTKTSEHYAEFIV